MLALFGVIFSYIVCFAAVLCTVVYLIYYVKFKHMIDVTRNIPSPPSLPIIGHAHHLIGTSPAENLNTLFRFVATYGTTFKLWLGPQLNIIVVDPNTIEQVVNNMRFIDKAYQYSLLEPWLKGGLLVSSGTKWHQRRKILTPGFHFQILKQFTDIMEKLSRVFLQNLDVEYGQQTGEGLDLHKWVDLYTLDVMCESVMGVSINAQANVNSEYMNALQIIRKVLHKRMFDLIYNLNFTYQFTKLSRECKKALSILHGFSSGVILKRREELLKVKKSGKPPLETDDGEGSKKKMVFLDILLHSEIDGKPLSNADISEEVDTFMFEGHDAPSGGILFTAYNLALHPKCQQTCVDEIVEVIGKDNSKPFTYEDLNKLHYLEQCIKETLRLYPPVPIIGRYITEDCEIDGKTIPAGATICIPTVVMGRQEAVFAEPLLFKPERFANDTPKSNPYAYIPFSAGPRNCIGQRFAVLELKTVLANTLRHYELQYVGERNEQLQLIAELVLRPKDPLMFKLKPRVL